MLQLILSGLFGTIPGIVSEIVKAKTDARSATTEEERIAANERSKALEMQRDVLVKESQTPWNSLARFFLMAPIGVYLWWIIVYDKIACKWFYVPEDVAAMCSTDALSPWLTGIAGMMVGFYFLGDLTRILKR